MESRYCRLIPQYVKTLQLSPWPSHSYNGTGGVNCYEVFKQVTIIAQSRFTPALTGVSPERDNKKTPIASSSYNLILNQSDKFDT